jgi:DNA-binding CsgD family transcriptional regulator
MPKSKEDSAKARGERLEHASSRLPPPRGLVVSRFTAGSEDVVVFEWPVGETRLPSCLSSAEAEVAALASEGLSNADIAIRRGTSTRTVANQIASIFQKLRVGSRHELVARLVTDACPD